MQSFFKILCWLTNSNLSNRSSPFRALYRIHQNPAYGISIGRVHCFLLLSGFLDDDKTIHQVSPLQLAFDGHLALHEVRQDHQAVLTLKAHDIAHDPGFRGLFNLIDSRQALKRPPYLASRLASTAVSRRLPFS